MVYKKSKDTKRKILEVASRIFKEKGYYDTEIKDIAAEINQSHASIYYYFKNKESIAREIFDQIVLQILEYIKIISKKEDNILLKIMIWYILLFKFIALNKATEVVYYDFVIYSNYDKENLIRLRNTYYRDLQMLFKKYNQNMDENEMLAYIVTSDAFAKALFKGVKNGILDFDLKEAINYFGKHIIRNNINIPEKQYIRTLDKAFDLCEDVVIKF